MCPERGGGGERHLRGVSPFLTIISGTGGGSPPSWVPGGFPLLSITLGTDRVCPPNPRHPGGAPPSWVSGVPPPEYHTEEGISAAENATEANKLSDDSKVGGCGMGGGTHGCCWMAVMGFVFLPSTPPRKINLKKPLQFGFKKWKSHRTARPWEHRSEIVNDKDKTLPL